MYIKWIVCNVYPKNKNAFSITQETWKKTKNAKGFITQIGGWNVNNSNEACIVSFWKDKSALEKFMKEMHDVIFEKNNQIETYESITVSRFDFDYPDDSLELFKQKISNVKSIRTVTNYENNDLFIEFSNNSLWFENENLKNTSINLVESWKII